MLFTKLFAYDNIIMIVMGMYWIRRENSAAKKHAEAPSFLKIGKTINANNSVALAA